MTYPLPVTITPDVTTGHADHSEQLNKRHNFEGPKVKADFEAAGNSHHNNGGGDDDWAKFQNAIDAAISTKSAAVLVESGSSYLIGSPLLMHGTSGTGKAPALIGIGNAQGDGNRGPTLVWGGPNDGTPRAMLDYSPAGGWTSGAPVIGLNLAGRYIENARAIRYSARCDLGSYIDDCWFQRWDGDSVRYEDGSTNGYIYRSRWDGCTGYNVHLMGPTSIFSIKDCTADNMKGTGALGDPLGFFYGERSTSDQNNVQHLYFENINLENHENLVDVEPDGTNEADKRGQFQFYAHAAHTTNQYIVGFNNLKFDTQTGKNSYSAFLMRGDGTAAQRGRRIGIVGRQLVGMGGVAATDELNYKKTLGNVAANMFPTTNHGFYIVFEHKPQNTETFGSHRIQTWQYTGTD